MTQHLFIMLRTDKGSMVKHSIVLNSPSYSNSRLVWFLCFETINKWRHNIHLKAGGSQTVTCGQHPGLSSLHVWSLLSSKRLYQRILKGESLSDPCDNATGRRPYWLSRVEVSYICTFGFGAIIQRDLCILPHNSQRDNLYACIFKSTRERQLTFNKLAWRTNYEKIRWYNNSPPYMTARWPPQQIPPLKFFGFNRGWRQ